MERNNPAADRDGHTQAAEPHQNPGPNAGQEDTDHFAVSLESLRLDTVTGFDLYLKTPRGQKFVLYRGADLAFSRKHKEKLQQSNVTHVYIATADRSHYLRYMEENLGSVIEDHSLPPNERSMITYDCATQLAREIMENPGSIENIKRSQNVARSIVDHLLKGVDQPAQMLDLLSFDYHTYTHSANVCILGIALGQRVGLSASELTTLAGGLFLHDVGKSEIDPAILKKQGPLTTEEWTIIKAHPAKGAGILKQTQHVDPSALAVVMQHHEKITGQGYPLGLKGPEIHLYAKIAALVDVFDALTTKRPYANALESFPAIRVMQQEMGSDFHPPIFRELILMLSRVRRAVRAIADSGAGPPQDQSVA